MTDTTHEAPVTMESEMKPFERKYDASPFDPTNPRDARSEAARQIIINSFLAAMDEIKTRTPEDVQDIAGGLFVGLVCIMASHIERTDKNDAHLRAGLMQMIPWAIDLMRDMEGKPLLAEA